MPGLEIRYRVVEAELVASFRIAYGEQPRTRSLIVEARLGDLAGLGEAAPSAMVTGETLEAARGYVEETASMLRGLSLPRQLPEALRVIHRAAPWFPAARAALESAVLAVAAAEAGAEPLLLLAPAAPPGPLETDFTIGLPPRSVLEEIARGRQPESFVGAVKYVLGLRREPPEQPTVPVPSVTGFKAVKLKLGTGSLELDLAIARLVYEAAEEAGARIRVDANQAWSPRTAVKAIKRLEAIMGDLLEVVEQPVPWWDLEGLAEARRAAETPIAADEAVKTPQDAARVAEKKAADIVNIKLAKAGGPLRARLLAATAEAHGLEAMWGCMVETGLGIAHAAYAAQASGHTRIVDLDSPLFLRSDPYGGYVAYTATPRGVLLEPRPPLARG